MNADTADSHPPSKEEEFLFRPLRPEQAPKVAPCQDNCPCGTSIRDWIAPIAQRSHLGLSTRAAYARAWELIVENNPFPAVMGRICPHPCETQCTRNDRDSAVAVSSLERYLGDWALDHGLKLPRLEPADDPLSFGVIGAGPAGLSYAYQVARRGHAVCVYDWHPEAGGMLRYGVPEYRLPRSVLDAEIHRIVELGVEVYANVRIGTDLTLSELRERHQHLFFGLGAQRARRLDVPGEHGPGVWTGTDFLEHYNTERPVSAGDHLAVVGGGNTAIDVARVGRRSGAQVTVLYRRTLQEMPAIEEEIKEAVDEGVEFIDLATPAEVLRAQSGELRGLVVQRMRPGALDEDGRRVPEPIPGTTFELPVTSVVFAVSQEADLRGLEDIAPYPGTSNGVESAGSRLSFGGDVLHLGIASAAIAEGKRAALQACNLAELADLEDHRKPLVKSERSPLSDRIENPETDPGLRLRNPGLEVRATISEAEFLKEVERCLSCGSCLGCYQCWMYCNAGSFTPVENPSPGNYFTFDSDICEGCGKCIELCPCGFLNPVE